MDEQLFVVWQEWPSGWRPMCNAIPADEAEQYARCGDIDGMRYRIVPRHTVTLADIIEG